MITNKSNNDKRIMSNKDQINYSMNNQNGLTHKSQQQQQVLNQQNQKPSNAYNKNFNYYYSNQTSNPQNQKYNKKKYNNNYYSNGSNGNFKNYNQNYSSLNRNSKNYRHNNQTGYNNNNAELKYDSTGNSLTSPIVSSNSSSTNTASPPSNLESPKSDSLNSLNNGANSVNNNNLKINKEELNQEAVDNSKIKESPSVNVQVGNSCISKEESQQEVSKKIDNETQATNESTITPNSTNANNLARDLSNLQITNTTKPHLMNNTTTSFKNNQNYHANRNKSPYNQQDINSNVISSTIKNDKYYDKQNQTSTVPINSSNYTFYGRQSNGKTYNNNSNYSIPGYHAPHNLNNGNYNQSTNGNFKSFNRNKKTGHPNHLLNNKNQYSATNQSNVPNSLLNKNQPKLLINPVINGANTNHATACNLSISQNQAIVPQMVPQNSIYYTPINYNQLQNLNQSHNQHSHHLMPNQHHPHYSQNCVQCATYVTAQNAYPQFVQPNAYQYQQQFVTLPAAYAYNQNLTALNTTEDVQQQQQNVNATTVNYRNENSSIKPTAQSLDQQPQQANTGAILNQANHPQNANIISVQNHPQVRQLNNYQMHYQTGKFNVNQQLSNQQEMMANYLQQFSYNNTYLGFPPSNYAPQYLQSVSNESQLPPMNMITNSITNMHPHPLHQQHTMNQYAINQSGQLQQEQYGTDQALSTIAAADSTTRTNSVNYDTNTAGGNLVLTNVAHQQNSIHQYHEQLKYYQANYQPASGIDYNINNNFWQQQQKANQVYNNNVNTNDELNMSSHNMASNANYQPQAPQTDSIAATPTTAEQLNNNSLNADSTVDKIKC